MALGGRRFININKNQMEDGVDVRGCIGEEVRPGRNVWRERLSVVCGGILIDEKNREMGGPLILDGRRLMGGHNNQPKVGIDSGRGIKEERQPGRDVWGGVVSLLGVANRRRKKTTTKILELYTTVLLAVFLVSVFCRYQIYLAVGISGRYY